MGSARKWTFVVVAAVGMMSAVAWSQEGGAQVEVVGEGGHKEFGLPPEPPADRKVRQKLEETVVSFTFVDQPVMEALAFLQTLGGVNIVPDRSKFQDPDLTVTLKLTNVKLATALNLLTEQIDLKWIVRDGLVFISDEEGTRLPPMSAAYDVRDLLRIPRGIHPVAMVDETDKQLKDLCELIRTVIEPGTWEGGQGNAIRGRPDPGMLVVTHTREVHAKLHDLLESLRRRRGGRAVTCTYLIRDLVLKPGEKWTPAMTRDSDIRRAQDDLVELVTDLVNPDSWGSRESGAYYWTRANFGVLVVHHDLKTQAAVADVLKRIRGGTAHLKTSTFIITDLLLEPGQAWTPASEKDENIRSRQGQIIALIRETIAPDSWTKDPGCTIRMRRDALVVTQTPLVLEKVTQLLNALTKKREREKAKGDTPADGGG